MHTQTILSKTEILTCVADSQDGRPADEILREMGAGRLMSTTDNLNRLLADAINNAVEDRDLDTLAQDLAYAAKQLQLASMAVKSRFL